jgi:hypothetical protein
MATLGRREMKKVPNPEPPQVGIAIPSVNLGVVPTVIYPITTLGVQPSYLGSPIMREGFITTTGLMPPSRIDD